MKAKYSKPMSPEQISKLKDQEIDLSDIPELSDEFWAEAKHIDHPIARKSIHLKVDIDVFDYFKQGGKGHLSRMQAVLRAYVNQKKKENSY